MRSSYPAPECFIAVAWLYLLDFHKDLCIGIFSFRTHAEQPVKQDCDFFHVGTAHAAWVPNHTGFLHRISNRHTVPHRSKGA